jgi:hypothetical protein
VPGATDYRAAVDCLGQPTAEALQATQLAPRVMALCAVHSLVSGGNATASEQRAGCASRLRPCGFAVLGDKGCNNLHQKLPPLSAHICLAGTANFGTLASSLTISAGVFFSAGAVATQLWQQLMHLAQHDKELSSPKYRLGSPAHRSKVSTILQKDVGCLQRFECPASTS